MRIEVTQDDIDKGVQCSSTNCAIARAVIRTYEDDERAAQISVSAHNISVNDDDSGYAWWEMSPEMKDWAEEFDLGDKCSVEPFSFDLDDLKGYKY